jgi:hypothetical protein
MRTIWPCHIRCAHDNVHRRLEDMGAYQSKDKVDVSVCTHSLSLISHEMLCRWPLFLDNTVAGGIPYGLSPFEALVKECTEEANLAESFVKAHAKPCGSVSYFYR